MNKIILKSGKEKAVLRHHPWIFSGAIATVSGDPENGSSVQVFDSKNNLLGIGAFSPYSQIRVRMWTFGHEDINQEFFEKRIDRAIKRRSYLMEKYNDSAWRLIHAESDQIPGLIVDQYNDVLVIQILSSGSEFNREILIEALRNVTKLHKIYERSDLDVRKMEGLKERTGKISGEIPSEIIINEGGHKFIVDLQNSQKTGFYIDQRINRRIVADYCKNKDVLNVFSFTGGFSIYAVGNNARRVVSLDSSHEALALAERNHILNGFPDREHEWLEGDAFQVLRKMRDQNQKFDVVILDPPKFAPTVAHVNKAARAYKDINLLGFKLLNPGGILVTFSCSGGIQEGLFQKIVSDAALDAGAYATILQKLYQGPDHPVSLNFPEGAYLKGLICLKN
ncbi:MAG: class I SAM-dependent rRNA methyltransferase [Anaerolineaceae bacterium]|jgi:23S rRNA (cytosine1962-C5)-methyltransferase|nr:class I SAM-dependent rRNA methyltransferase [Anaerolineaceae bacterium]